MKKQHMIPFTICLTTDEIVDALLGHESLTQDVCFELIKKLDLTQEDYGFTERCAKYFKDELAKEDQHG